MGIELIHGCHVANCAEPRKPRAPLRQQCVLHPPASYARPIRVAPKTTFLTCSEATMTASQQSRAFPMVLELTGPGPRPPTRPSGWPITRLLPVVLVGLIFLAMLPVIGIAYFAAQSNYDASSRQLNELTRRHDRAAPAGACRAGARPARLYQRRRGQGRDRLRRPRAMAHLRPGHAGRRAAGRGLRRHSRRRRADALHTRRPQHAAGAAREPALHRCSCSPRPAP